MIFYGKNYPYPANCFGKVMPKHESSVTVNAATQSGGAGGDIYRYGRFIQKLSIF